MQDTSSSPQSEAPPRRLGLRAQPIEPTPMIPVAAATTERLPIPPNLPLPPAEPWSELPRLARTQPTRKLRAEGPYVPETWGEYALWKATKRMKSRDRQVVLAFSAIDLDLRDFLDEAIHEAFACTTKFADTIMANEPRLLLHDGSRHDITRQLGEILFATTWIFDILSENWARASLSRAATSHHKRISRESPALLSRSRQPLGLRPRSSRPGIASCQ